MNVAILHYHFNRGGVTQVVLNHLAALDQMLLGGERIQVALIHGGRRSGIADDQVSDFRSLDVSMHSLPSLDYDDNFKVDEEQLAGEIVAVLEGIGFPSNTTLLHIHNHSLGKNVALPGAIRRLAQAGYRLLLQIHDFAEDLRPENYRRLAAAGKNCSDAYSCLYLQAGQIHYAVLNRRDFTLLNDAGVPSANLHLLPNAAGDFGELPAKEVARRKLEERFKIPRDATYALYPVRGIRRKNLGEVLLWSVLASQGCFIGVTLAPLNPLEQVAYQHWVQLSRELELPCVFETGGENGLAFKENLAAADLLLTTSVAEGFGMVFLEAWLAGRNLVGRDLPEITTDFVEAGLQLNSLYAQLLVPIDWVGRDSLRESLGQALNHLRINYGITSTPDDASVEHEVGRLLRSETIDFGVLSCLQQTCVIRMVQRDQALREQLLELNPRLRIRTTAEDNSATIAANADVVRSVFSLVASGKRLKQLYGCVMESHVETDIQSLPHPDRILNAFLDVQRLRPLRFEE